MSEYSHERFEAFEGTVIVGREADGPEVGDAPFCQREINEPLTTTGVSDPKRKTHHATGASCRANVPRSW